MTNYGLIGSETPIDDLLDQYFPGAPENLLYEAFESEQAALMAALLMEMRGDDVDQDVSGDSEAVYFSEAGVAVEGIEEQSVAWNFSADTVVIYGFDATLAVAFKAPNKANRLIKLQPDDAPFSLSPPGGLGAAQVWYRKLNDTDANTSFNVLAFK
jgi:hypothetical protein